MVIGVPRELKLREYRVAITPSGARELAAEGHEVYIERGAGEGSGFSDQEFTDAGARVSDKKTLFAKSEIIVKVKEPLPEEYGFFESRHVLFTFLHLAPNRKLTEFLLERNITALAYETLEEDGTLPLLTPMSEIAGRMSPIMAGYFLQKPHGGAGILPTGAAGVPPAEAVIIGAGTVGSNAVRVAHAMGMTVTVINKGVEKLRHLDELYGGHIKTLPASEQNTNESVLGADIVIGAVLIPGERAPKVVAEETVKKMKKGSVLVDVSIDQGGCFETSRPTTHDDPVYEMHGILHYCVTNMPGAYPRTSALSLTNSTLPFIKRLASGSIERAIREDQALRSAVNTFKGAVVHMGLASSSGFPLGKL